MNATTARPMKPLTHSSQRRTRRLKRQVARRNGLVSLFWVTTGGALFVGSFLFFASRDGGARERGAASVEIAESSTPSAESSKAPGSDVGATRQRSEAPLKTSSTALEASDRAEAAPGGESAKGQGAELESAASRFEAFTIERRTRWEQDASLTGSEILESSPFLMAIPAGDAAARERSLADAKTFAAQLARLESSLTTPLELKRREGFGGFAVCRFPNLRSFERYFIARGAEVPFEGTIAHYELKSRALVICEDPRLEGFSAEYRRHELRRESARMLLDAFAPSGIARMGAFWFERGLSEYLAAADRAEDQSRLEKRFQAAVVDDQLPLPMAKLLSLEREGQLYHIFKDLFEAQQIRAELERPMTDLHHWYDAATAQLVQHLIEAGAFSEPTRRRALRQLFSARYDSVSWLQAMGYESSSTLEAEWTAHGLAGAHFANKR